MDIAVVAGGRLDPVGARGGERVARLEVRHALRVSLDPGLPAGEDGLHGDRGRVGQDLPGPAEDLVGEPRHPRLHPQESGGLSLARQVTSPPGMSPPRIIFFGGSHLD